jgi:hypothetical protein
VAHLQKQVPAAGFGGDLLHSREVRGWGFLEVKVLAGFQHGEAIGGMIANGRFDGNDANVGMLEQLIPGKQRYPLVPKAAADRGVGFADAYQLPFR